MSSFRSKRDRKEKMKSRSNKGTVMSRIRGFFRTMCCISSSGLEENGSCEVESTPHVQVEDETRSPKVCGGGKVTEGFPWNVRFPGEGSCLSNTHTQTLPKKRKVSEEGPTCKRCSKLDECILQNKELREELDLLKSSMERWRKSTREELRAELEHNGAMQKLPVQTNSPSSRVNFLVNKVNSLQVIVNMKTKQIHDAETMVQNLQKELENKHMMEIKMQVLQQNYEDVRARLNRSKTKQF